MSEPTDEDRRRDLAADLATCDGILHCGNLMATVTGYPPTIDHILMPPNGLELLAIGPAAIRRALWAESLLRELVEEAAVGGSGCDDFGTAAFRIATRARLALGGRRRDGVLCGIPSHSLDCCCDGTGGDR